MAEVIRFYRVGEPYGLFSNLSPHPVFIDRRWPTAEHSFQAQKFSDDEAKDAIANTDSPAEAARLGRGTRWSLRADWNDVRDDVMRIVVRAKVAQHRSVYEALMETGDAQIVEHTTNDHYWADGGDGSGRNMLGRILMEIRAEIVADGDAELSGMLPPPWAALPGLPRMSVGWRMGFGESFIGRWGATYDALSPAARLRYQQRWPVPAGGEWTDYWETEV